MSDNPDPLIPNSPIAKAVAGVGAGGAAVLITWMANQVIDMERNIEQFITIANERAGVIGEMQTDIDDLNDRLDQLLLHGHQHRDILE